MSVNTAVQEKKRGQRDSSTVGFLACHFSTFLSVKNATTRAFLPSFGADRQSEMHGMSAWEKAWCACFGFCVSKRNDTGNVAR
jgi:hypothetical protein